MSARIYAILFGTSLLSAPALAQDDPVPISLHGAVRARYETIEGQPRAGFNSSDALFNLRTQVSAEYRAADFRAFAEIYDSRAYGAKAGTPLTTGEVNTLELVQAYLATDLKGVMGSRTALGLQAGRMLLNIGSRRLVAADEYRNTTNSYTGIRADASAPNGIKATLYYVLPQTRLPDDLPSLRAQKVRMDRESFDQVLWGGVASKARAIGPATIELSFTHFGERDAPGRPTRDRSLNSLGARIIADPVPGRIDYEGEAIWQLGSISTSLAANAAHQQVRASFVHADLGYTFPTKWRPHLVLEFDRASGDRPGGRYGHFDTLFGMRRADLAPAGLYNAVGRANILTAGLRAEVTPSKRVDGFLSYRPMWLDSAEDSFSTTGVRDPGGHTGRFAGHQIDSRLRYWLVPDRLRFEFDGVLLAKGRFLREAPNAPPGRWARYASFNLTAGF